MLITNLTLADIVREAYSVKIFQMSGGPGWLDSDRFNIEGKAAGEANRQELMAMLRALLADRFQLKTHREDRQGNAYELIVEMHGPKLRPSAADTSYLRLERNTPPELPGVSYTIRAQKTTLAQLADFLMGSLGGQVFNRTGITGEFDFSVNYAIDDHAEVGPSIFMALKEQLGLTLGPTKASITVLVIDSVERPQAN